MKEKNQKELEAWNKRKQEIDRNSRIIYFRKGEIWWCALGVNVGHEQDGKNENFERPVLVLRKINRHLALILPLSSKIKNHPYYHRYRQDGKTFSAIIFQLRVVSTKRFLRRLGTIKKDVLDEILDATIGFLKEG